MSNDLAPFWTCIVCSTVWTASDHTFAPLWGTAWLCLGVIVAWKGWKK